MSSQSSTSSTESDSSPSWRHVPVGVPVPSPLSGALFVKKCGTNLIGDTYFYFKPIDNDNKIKHKNYLEMQNLVTHGCQWNDDPSSLEKVFMECSATKTRSSKRKLETQYVNSFK